MRQLFVCLIAVLCPVLAHPASVRLLSGEYYEGKLDLADNGVNVTAPGGSAVSIDASKILSAVFKKPAGPNVTSGVVLVDGTILSGVIANMDGPTILAGSPTINVPIANVAWVVFGPSAREKLTAVNAPNRSGALLPSGDFFPGTVEGVKDNKLSVNSVLFGPRKLTLHQQVAAVQLRGVQTPGGRLVFIGKDGTEFSSDNATIDHSGVSIHDALAGDVKIKAEDLTEIDAARTRYQPVNELTPQKIVPPAGMKAEDAYQVQIAGPDDPVGAPPMLVTAVNAQVAYAVPAGFDTFACSVAVAKDAPPATRLAFALYGDGRLLVRNPPVGPDDPPQALHAALTGVRVLTLRVEPGVPLAAPASGEWIAPIFPKP